MPALLSFVAASPVLFWDPLSAPLIWLSYGGLLGTQALSLGADVYFKRKEVAPVWIVKYKLLVSAFSLSVTVALFLVHL